MPGKNYGKRPDGSRKGSGYLGELQLPDGGVATEFSIANDAVGKLPNGEWRDFPAIVPGLTAAELAVLVSDVIPNGRQLPREVERKATAHALARLLSGQDVWAGAGDVPFSSSQLNIGGMPKTGAKGFGLRQQMQGALAWPHVLERANGRAVDPQIAALAKLYGRILLK